MSDNFFGKLFGGSSSEDEKKAKPNSPAVRNVANHARPAAQPTHPQRPTTNQAQRSTGIPAHLSQQQPARPQPPRPQPQTPQSQTPQPPRPQPQRPDQPASPPVAKQTMSKGKIEAGDEYKIDDLLKLVFEKGGSDLHLTVASPPMIRLQGKLWPTELPSLTEKDTKRLIFQFLSNEHRERLEKDLELDISYEIPQVSRYRCNIFYSRLGLGGVFRVIPTKIKTLQELKMPPVLSDLARRNKGLILVTGPTGSGKSTTLASMVDQINNERQDHILTIEDPIEFVHKHKTSLVNQREIGPNTKSFANALRSALREDPDIILVGELRDFETISLAVTAAETGHLVFATLHTPSAAQSVERIVDVFPAHQQEQIRTQLADSLQGIIAQQLIPTIDGMSRSVALEILINTPAVSNLIRENKTFQLPSIMQTNKQSGMQTMDQSLLDLVKQRRISPQEAYRRAFDKKAFEQYKPNSF